ncbi:MAG: hypothetical protein FD163_2349 [Hyphomonadaceae bacterium]|nr:MAG: hypothetical protein FD128_359 [Hyphomonadaceae bacterium]KAF0183629.1 MAG: hypothetical protein FD163_2349 [Hyphomonadaceae bacterium]
MKSAVGLGILIGGAALAVAAIAPVSQDAAKATPTLDATLDKAVRIAIAGVAGEGCSAAPSDLAAKAYIAHLSSRLNRPVLLCPAKDKAAAANALISNNAEIALLDTASFLPVKDQAQSIFVGRYSRIDGRVLGVAMTLKADGITDISKLSNKRPIFLSEAASGHAIELQALSDYGFNTKEFGPEVIIAENEALEALRQKRGDVLITTAGARQRICRSDDPQEVLCGDIAEIWRGRPSAPFAFVASREISDADKYQLIGIHIVLHTENPTAFAFIEKVMPTSIALDPSEADALLKGQRR